MSAHPELEIKLNKVQRRVAGKICNYILSHNLEPGSPLPVNTLAKELKVSRTPIQPALSYLTELGLVESVRNRGALVKQLTDKQENLMRELGSSQEDKLYFSIAKDKISGALGDEVSEAYLVRRYGVDRTVINDVLKSLAQDGLIHNKPGRGWIFESSLNTPEAYEESYNFRKLILANCLYEPTYKFDRALFEKCRYAHYKLLENCENPSVREIATVNAIFYETIARFSGNRFVLKAVEQQNRIRRFLEYSFKWSENPEHLKMVCTKHLEILEIIESGNLAKASHYIWMYLDRASQINSVTQ